LELASIIIKNKYKWKKKLQYLQPIEQNMEF
jgi:hypothetical protein